MRATTFGTVALLDDVMEAMPTAAL